MLTKTWFSEHNQHFKKEGKCPAFYFKASQTILPCIGGWEMPGLRTRKQIYWVLWTYSEFSQIPHLPPTFSPVRQVSTRALHPGCGRKSFLLWPEGWRSLSPRQKQRRGWLCSRVGSPRESHGALCILRSTWGSWSGLRNEPISPPFSLKLCFSKRPLYPRASLKYCEKSMSPFVV